MKTTAKFFLLILLASGLSAQTINLKIIETTDTHGKIYPYDFKNDRESNSSLAQVYTYLEQQRADNNQEVILLSGGDILQGTPAVYYYNFEDTIGTHLYADVMNFMKYDAGVVGNHDIETGHPVYDKFDRELNFPWLAANAINATTGEPYFQPYTIIDKQGVKVAVLGLITPHIPHWLPEKIWSGMEFEDMIESAEKWVEIIQEKENPDILIGLFHAGVDYTYGGAEEDTYKNENASKLVAEQVPGFDVVFVGHDHHGWNIKVADSNGDSVLILGGTSYARDVSVADVVANYDSADDSWDINLTGSMVAVKDYQPDSVFMQRYSIQFETVKEYVSRPIGEFTSAISTRESMFGSSAFCDLINSIQLELTGADISFTAPLSGNAEIRKGTVYVRDMFELYRYENLLYTMELTGEEIKNYLEYTSAKWFNQMKDENDHLLRFVTDDNGELVYSKRNNMPMLAERYYNFDAGLGLNYTVDVSKPAGERVTISGMSDGREFDPDKTYKVAINSYRGNGGGGHLVEGAGIDQSELDKRIINSTEKDLRYYMMKWIEKQGKVNPVSKHNWKVIPEKWWFKGMKKDYKLLFPE